MLDEKTENLLNGLADKWEKQAIEWANNKKLNNVMPNGELEIRIAQLNTCAWEVRELINSQK